MSSVSTHDAMANMSSMTHDALGSTFYTSRYMRYDSTLKQQQLPWPPHK